jgi:Predicted membrane protein
MNFIVSLLPVFLFLLFLIFIDSFKLVKVKDVFICILFGVIAAGAAYVLNSNLLPLLSTDILYYSRYAAPVVEEILKVLFLIFLIKKNKIGFIVDGSILGFAIGAGFSSAENMYYLNAISASDLFVWIVRGLGTAIMHGITTSSVAIIVMGYLGRHEKIKTIIYFYGIIVAVVIHSVYNHFFVSPFVSAIVILAVLPLAMSAMFQFNDISLRKWLEVEFDTEARLLEMINKGLFAETKAGKFLLTIKNKFPAEVVIDILCYMKIYLELSIRAKSILLLQEAGFNSEKDPALEDKLKEFKYLQKNIGKTGMLAISPVLRFKRKDLWKINLLK